MAQYIIAYSRFFITLLGAAYAVLALAALAVCRFHTPADAVRGKLLLTGQCIILFIWQLTGFLTICVETGNVDYLFFYAFSQLVLFACIMLFSMIYPGINRALINHMCFLTGCGLMMLARLDLKKAWKQLLIFAVAVSVSLALPTLIRRFKKLRDFLWIYAAAGAAALAAVLILGSVTHGSKLSWSIAGITFQPSEFVKLLFVFFTAAVCSRIAWLSKIGSRAGKPEFMNFRDRAFTTLLTGCGIAGVHVLLLVLSRDLGSALIFFVTFLFLVYMATGQFRYLGLGALAGCGGAFLAYRIFTHVQVRVQAWKDPWSVIDSQGYQITQSLFALGRGGWFGLGIGQGTPKDIPYVETDFVFAAVSEELGILFSVFLLVVCVVCFLELLKISAESEEVFYSLAAAGFGIMYIFQVFLTVGGGIKFIPLTGVTLPFVSYGGSSLMASVFGFAASQGIILHSRDMQDEWDRSRTQDRRRAEKTEPSEEAVYPEEFWNTIEIPQSMYDGDLYEEEWNDRQ